MWYKIFMLVMVPAVIIGWVIYYFYMKKIEEQEAEQPKKESQRLTQTKTEVSDWAKKMAAFESPREKMKRERAEREKQQGGGQTAD
mgnify:CR=1 FL=1